MTSYLAMASKHLAMHKRKTRLSILSIVVSVALVAGIFSMLDVFLLYEKAQIINDFGNYHIAVKDAVDAERAAIAARIDVRNAGMLVSFKGGAVNGASCEVIALDEQFAPNMGIRILEGTYPEAENELALERWAAEEFGLGIGDTVSLSIEGNLRKSLVVSGVFSDYGITKAAGEPGIVISMRAAETAGAEKTRVLLVEFKNGADIKKAVKQIEEALGIPEDRLGRNERLLAVIGQSDHRAAVGLYHAGAILFVIVLVAGVVMIYNSFNISVLERIRQFGLLRCVGASRAQIRALVRREGLVLLAWALPSGLLLGVAVTSFCCAILKFYSGHLFSGMPLFYVSPVGMAAEIGVGVLTVSIASDVPARRAARVSPLNAVTGNSEIGGLRPRKAGMLIGTSRIETSMGVRNAVMNRKTLLLMSASIALSVTMLLGFNVLVNFLHVSLKTTKPYTPDISLVSEQGLDGELCRQLSAIDGIDRVYGRMFAYVNATFDASRLTEDYKQRKGGIRTREDGLFDAPEESWLISYDKNQLNWSRIDLLEGTLSEDILNQRDGVIAVWSTTSNSVSMRNADLHIGDKVFIETPAGRKEFTVMAVLRSVPFNDSRPNLTTFITTEEQFTEMTGRRTYEVINIQIANRNQERTVAQIRSLAGSGVSFLDSRQKNREVNQTFLTMAVFVYGFVAVIALISILNMVNTMNTSVASKTRYLGILRAVGMSGRQIYRMIAAEAATYTITGCVAGCILGMLLQQVLINHFLTANKMVWTFPLRQIIYILITAALVTGVSIIGPVKRITTTGISEVIGSL